MLDWSPHPGVQGEAEGGVEGEGEVEGLALAGQCLAKARHWVTREEETSSHIVALTIFDYLKIRYFSGRAAQVMLLSNPGGVSRGRSGDTKRIPEFWVVNFVWGGVLFWFE